MDGRTFEADVIVQATGYSQRFPFLHNGDGGAKQTGEGAKQTNGKSEALPSTVTTRKNKRKKKNKNKDPNAADTANSTSRTQTRSPGPG